MIRIRTLIPGLVGLVSCLLLGSANATVLKIATVAPEGSEWMRAHREAGEEIKQRTDGRVVLKFYSGGVMGNDKKGAAKNSHRSVAGRCIYDQRAFRALL